MTNNIACGDGFYKLDGDGTCFRCPLNSNTGGRTTSTVVTDCMCTPGYEGNAASNADCKGIIVGVAVVVIVVVVALAAKRLTQQWLLQESSFSTCLKIMVNLGVNSYWCCCCYSCYNCK